MTRPWHECRMLAVDFETTGVNVEEDRIVTAAVIELGGGQPVDADTMLINPGIEIPEGASAIHGITTEKARAEGQEAAPAIQDIASMITLAIRSRVPLVGMNIGKFDLTILDRECRRYGVPVPDWSQVRVVDVLVIDKWLDRYRHGHRRLQHLCAHYGVRLDDAHNATADAMAAARVAWVQATRGVYVRGRGDRDLTQYWETIRHDIERLHAHQIEAAAEQAVSLREYFERKGDHEAAASVSTHWPVAPVSLVSCTRENTTCGSQHYCAQHGCQL